MHARPCEADTRMNANNVALSKCSCAEENTGQLAWAAGVSVGTCR